MACDAYKAGFDAGYAGLPVERNPYSPNGGAVELKNFSDWDLGYADGASGPDWTCEDDDDPTYEGDEYDESMDGDFDSGMASAGMGMDEDYGDCEGYEDDGRWDE